jgi:hypothetical protein
METTRARERTRSSACRFCIVVAGPILLVLLAAGCAMPQSPSSAAPPAALSASPAVPQPTEPAGLQPAEPTALQPAPETLTPQPATKVPPAKGAKGTAAPPTLTYAPTATPMPALPTLSRPLPQAAPNPCTAGDAITSVDYFPEPPSIRDGCHLIGRSLTHNLENVSSEGSDIGEDLVQVTSEGCMWNGELQWDYVYTVSYSCDCPKSLGDILPDQSGPWDVYFVGRTLCIDSNCTTEGSTSGTPEPASWTCNDRSYHLTRYWTQGNKDSPEPSTLLLMAGGVSGLAGWVVLQHRRRKRG